MGLLRRARGPVPLQAALLLFERGSRAYQALSARERSEALQLVRASRGRPGTLDARQRRRLRALAAKAGRGATRRKRR